MAEVRLTQAEADALLLLPKRRVDEKVHYFPGLGGILSVGLESEDRREQFLLDVRRGRTDLMKATYQNRARSVVILARLDLAGSPHRNPDGATLPCPHLHVFQEGYGDKWAVPLPAGFGSPGDQWSTLHDFMSYCHIVHPPWIEKELFT